MEDRVRLTIDNGVAHLRLNRPDKMNALDPAMFAAIIETGTQLGARNGLREARPKEAKQMVKSIRFEADSL